MLELRGYQQDCINNVRGALRQFRNVLLQAPTGAGKTAMASKMLGTIHQNNSRGFFICHRRELVEQTSKTFQKVGIPHSFVASGFRYDPYAPIHICSIDTLKNRLDKIHLPKLCLWDEAHHIGAAGWDAVHGFMGQAYHVGLSATPVRLDGQGLDKNFDYLVPGPQVQWLIEQGYLAKYKMYSVPGADMKGVHTRMGDFVKSETEQVMDRSTITGDIIKHWRRHAIDKLTIGFAVSVKHSLHICEQFRAAGIMAAHLDGTTPPAERKAVLQAFARGDIRVIFNVGLFGEGFDVAANSGLDVTVGCVIDAAPTQSLGAWLQRCGRALRPQSGHAIILDHAGNAMRHGLPCEEREWTLEGKVKGRKKKGDEEPEFKVKQCEKCFSVYRSGFTCPSCGHTEMPVGRNIEEVDGDLAEIDPEVFRKQQRQAQGRANSLEEFAELGISEKQAKHIIKARKEKEALQLQVYNLQKAMIAANIPFKPLQIRTAKPKQLREQIELLNALMGQQTTMEIMENA